MRTLRTLRGSGLLWTASLILDRLVPFGVLRLWPRLTVPAAVLSEQLHEVLRAWGVPPDQAETVVEHMLHADLSGIDSEGCAMLLYYDRRRSEGSLRMAPAVRVVRDEEATAVVDGDGGMGHVTGAAAMRIAIEKCRGLGVGAVAVRNSGHFGATGIYASMAASAGFIGLATTSTREPALVPTFGAEPMLGTNPIAFAAPAADGRPFVLDMATSAASIGGAWTAWRAGRMLPSGWAVNRKGRSIRSGRRAASQRRLTPLGSSRRMGSHKGYGLALAMEVLSTVLSGADTKGAGPPPREVGHFFLAVDPARFRGDGGFAAALEAVLDSLRAATPVDPRRPVLVAGDPERATRAERSRSGIPLARAVVEDVRAVARAAGVPFLLEEDRRR